MKSKKYIVFVCGHNAGRSQMCEGFFNILSKNYKNISNKYLALSFGTEIANEVNPRVIDVSSELGLDLSNSNMYFPKTIDFFLNIGLDISKIERVYTCGCMKNNCNLPNKLTVYDDLNLDDPANPQIDTRILRDDLIAKIKNILLDLNQLNEK